MKGGGNDDSEGHKKEPYQQLAEQDKCPHAYPLE